MELSLIRKFKEKYNFKINDYSEFPIEEARFKPSRRPTLNGEKLFITIADLDMEDNRINLMIFSEFDDEFSLEWQPFESVKGSFDDKELEENLEEYLYHLVDKYKINMSI